LFARASPHGGRVLPIDLTLSYLASREKTGGCQLTVELSVEDLFFYFISSQSSLALPPKILD